MAATHALDDHTINNSVYDELGERWYTAEDDPIALLRAEARLRNPWIAAHLQARRGTRARVLDVGCGAGFLTNALARDTQFEMHGLDASPDSLAVAARHDATRRVAYRRGDALALPYPDGAFDGVCAMDLLEHVDEPARVVAEAARVLRPGGLFFFHTFNRNPWAWLVVIKGVEWFVKNTPPRLHILRFFVKPRELDAMCAAHGLAMREIRGAMPAMASRPFWRMLTTGTVTNDFRFVFTRSTIAGYCGVAERGPRHASLRASDAKSASSF